MKILRRTKIRFETYERSLVSFPSSISKHCELCLTETEHLTIFQFSQRSSLSERRIFHLAETGLLHGWECDDGRFLICAGEIDRTDS